MCKDVEETRTGLKLAGWLILGSIIALILWNVFYILNHNKHKKEGVKVGTGDDPDDYDEEDRASYLLGYLIWGIVMITLDILLICCVTNYIDSFPPEPTEEMMEEEMKKEEEEKKDDEKKEDDAAAEPADNAEGGAVERLSASSRGSKKSVSKKSNRNEAAPAAFTITNNNEAVRAAAFKDLDIENTPRSSYKNDTSYEEDKTS